MDKKKSIVVFKLERFPQNFRQNYFSERKRSCVCVRVFVCACVRQCWRGSSTSRDNSSIVS